MPTPKLLDQVRAVIRVKHFSLSTERAYVGWIRRFILFHHKKHRTKSQRESRARAGNSVSGIIVVGFRRECGARSVARFAD